LGICDNHLEDAKTGALGLGLTAVFALLVWKGPDIYKGTKKAIVHHAERERAFADELIMMDRSEAKHYLQERIPKMNYMEWGFFGGLLRGLSRANARAKFVSIDAEVIRRGAFPDEAPIPDWL
jgi:hypothetical protein